MERAELAAALRARLAVAGAELPATLAGRLEQDLALHLERLRTLAEAAELSPADPPATDPTGPAVGGPVAGGPSAAGRAAGGPARVAATPAPAPAGSRSAVTPAAPRPDGPERLPGVVEAARRVAAGEVTSTRLVEQALDRIAAHDRAIGAFVAVLADEALAEAAARDRELAAGRWRGPLHGVPVAVKDLVDVAGAVTAAGSPKLAGNLAVADAEAVARLRRAGAVVLGKTRTHEFAYGVLTPGTVNPWDPGRIAGGSSGGSAAAVAAGLVPGAVGSDTAGSIRIPAACCGVVGVKPTYGAVPATGVFPLSWSCDHVGPIAPSVADAATLWQVLVAGTPAWPPTTRAPAAGLPAGPQGGAGLPAGPAVRLPAGPMDAGHRAGEIGGAGEVGEIGEIGGVGEVGRLRLGWLVGDTAELVEPAVAGQLAELRARLAAAGARIDEVSLPLAAGRAAVAAMVLAELAAVHALLVAETGEDGYSPRMLAAIRLGQATLAGEYLAGLRYRVRFARQVEALLAGRDALVLPTIPVVAPAIGQRSVALGSASMGVQEALTMLPGPFNGSGSPVVSLPVGLAGGLPVAASLVGGIGRDAALFKVAASIEAQLARIGPPPAYP